jgi:hypothetical protein
MDSILSTPNSGSIGEGVLFSGRLRVLGMAQMGLMRHKEFKETRGRDCEQPSGIAWYQKLQQITYRTQHPCRRFS